jgi:hypothetical protein
LLNKNTETIEEQILLLEERDRRLSFIIAVVFFHSKYSCFVEFVLAGAWMRRGMGLGAYELILLIPAWRVESKGIGHRYPSGYDVNTDKHGYPLPFGYFAGTM